MNCIQRFFDRLPEWKIILILTLFAALTAFYCLSGRILLSGDETRVAGIIRELQFSPKPFFLPRLNGVPFLEYPPLYYWGGAFFISAFGVSYGTIKAMSALSFSLSILLVFGLARKLKLDKATAFFSAVMPGLAFAYFSTGRTCMVDITLGFFVLMAVFGFCSGMTASNWKTAMFYYIVYAAGAGCAVMTKGLLGLALPGVILFFTLLFQDIAERQLHWKRWLILGFASLAALIPAACWAYQLYCWMGWDDFYEVMYTNNLGRFSGSQGDHKAPFYYYLQRLPELFQPWLLLIPFGLWKTWQKFRRERDCGSLFLLCAFLAPLLLLSAASAKRNVYLIPIYPAAMLLAAAGLTFLLELLCRKIPEEKLLRTGRLTGLVLTVLTAAAAVVLIGLYPPILLWTILPLLFAAAGLFMFLRGKQPLGYLLLLLTLAALFPCADAVLPNRFAPNDNLESLFRRIGELEKQNRKVYLFEPTERLLGAAVYYRGHLMPVRKRKDYDGRSSEIWVLRKRDRKKTAPYGDHHYIVQMPEGNDL